MSLALHYDRCTSLLRAPRLRNDLYCVEWDVELYYTVSSTTTFLTLQLHRSALTGSTVVRHKEQNFNTNTFPAAKTDFFFC